jgi:hypothetical protein
LTKQEPVENSLKCQLSIDETIKDGFNGSKLVEINVVAMCNPKIFSEEQSKLKVAPVGKKIQVKRSRLARITQRLYDLESCNEPEKPLCVKLDLYQMEDY